eukprot:7316285-Prymnesium_polylepis.2
MAAARSGARGLVYSPAGHETGGRGGPTSELALWPVCHTLGLPQHPAQKTRCMSRATFTAEHLANPPNHTPYLHATAAADRTASSNGMRMPRECTEAAAAEV